MLLPKSFTTVTPLSKVIAMILFVSLPFVGYYLGMKYEQSISVNNIVQIRNNNFPTPIPSPALSGNPITTPALTTANDFNCDWKIYKSSGPIKYEFNYPQNWVHKYNPDVVILDSPDGNRVTITCSLTKLPSPNTWEPNEHGYTVKGFKKFLVNGNEAQQYIWSEVNGLGDLNTDILRKTNPIVCSVILQRVEVKSNYKDFITSQTGYNQIVNSFVFTK